MGCRARRARGRSCTSSATRAAHGTSAQAKRATLWTRRSSSGGPGTGRRQSVTRPRRWRSGRSSASRAAPTTFRPRSSRPTGAGSPRHARARERVVRAERPPGSRSSSRGKLGARLHRALARGRAGGAPAPETVVRDPRRVHARARTAPRARRLPRGAGRGRASSTRPRRSSQIWEERAARGRSGVGARDPRAVSRTLRSRRAVISTAPSRASSARSRSMRAATDPFHHARTLLALGRTQRRAKKRAAARATLEDALARFEALGAPLWAEQTRAELARIGGRAPSRGELTEAERRIAELVAEGRTNREVAAALFLTEHSVETALTRIYRKLGVRSRGELARLRSTARAEARVEHRHDADRPRGRARARSRGCSTRSSALPGALVLHGEAGIGKTSLWLAGVEPRGASAATACCRADPSEAETRLSYAGLTDLLGDVVDDVLPELPPIQRRALEAALLLGEPDAGADERAVAAAFLSSLRLLVGGRAALPRRRRPPVARRGVDDAALSFALVTARRQARSPCCSRHAASRRRGSRRSLPERLDDGRGRRAERRRAARAAPDAARRRRSPGRRCSGSGRRRPATRSSRSSSPARSSAAAIRPRPGDPLPLPSTPRRAPARAPRRPRRGRARGGAARRCRRRADRGPRRAGAARRRRRRASPRRSTQGSSSWTATGCDSPTRCSEPRSPQARHLRADAPLHAGSRRSCRRRRNEHGISRSSAIEPDETIAAAIEEAAQSARARGAPAAAAELAEQALRLTPPGERAAATRRLFLAADRYWTSAATSIGQRPCSNRLGPRPLLARNAQPSSPSSPGSDGAPEMRCRCTARRCRRRGTTTRSRRRST